MPRRPPRRPTDRRKGTKPSFFRVRPPTPDVASTMFAILAIFFSAPSHTPEHPRDGGIAHPYSRHTRQKLAPLRQRRRRALFEVRLQELPRRFVELRFGARALLRGERLSFACGGGVALDGREAHAEGPCDFSGGRAPFFGFDDLLPQVQRVGVHVGILPYRPTTLQGALREIPVPPRDSPQKPSSRLSSAGYGGSSKSISENFPSTHSAE